MNDFNFVVRFQANLLTMRKGYAKLPEAAKQTIEHHRAYFKNDTISHKKEVTEFCNGYVNGLEHAGLITPEERKELILYMTYADKYMYCSP